MRISDWSSDVCSSDLTEEEFLQRTEGSAIRRSGHARWLRNIAVALGNAPTTPEVVAALESRRDQADPVVRAHVEWALARHGLSEPTPERPPCLAQPVAPQGAPAPAPPDRPPPPDTTLWR